MNIHVRTIPHKEQRYDTVGDWLWDENPTPGYPNSGSMGISVSDLGDWRMEACVAIHELVEALLCRARGITQEQVDQWDQRMTGASMCDTPECERNTEPGDHPDCPYRDEHFAATTIERILARELGVDWLEYEEKIAAL